MKERRASYPAEPSYRQIMVGGAMIGITGLGEIFAELYKEGRVPNGSLKEELLSKARENN